MRLHLVYRSAPVENNAQRPAYYSKDACFGSFLTTLQDPDLPLGDVLFVNDGEITGPRRKAMEKYGGVLELPRVGNAPSYRAILSLPDWRGWSDDDLLYLIEDDYLHVPDALSQLLRAVAEIPHAAFFTLYRHPSFLDTDSHRRYRKRTAGAARTVGEVRWDTCWGTPLTYAGRVEQFRLIGAIHSLAARERHPDDIAMWKATQRVLPYRLLGLFVPRSGLRDQEVVRAAAVDLVTRRSRKEGLLMFPTPTLATHVQEPYLAAGRDWARLAREGLAEL